MYPPAYHQFIYPLTIYSFIYNQFIHHSHLPLHPPVIYSFNHLHPSSYHASIYLSPINPLSLFIYHSTTICLSLSSYPSVIHFFSPSIYKSFIDPYFPIKKLALLSTTQHSPNTKNLHRVEMILTQLSPFFIYPGSQKHWKEPIWLMHTVLNWLHTFAS